jgi:hypothetical protein
MVIHGRMYHQMPPLQPAEGNLPINAQIYIHDPQQEAGSEYCIMRFMCCLIVFKLSNFFFAILAARVGNLFLPARISEAVKLKVKNLVQRLKELLTQCNPYARELRMACEMPELRTQRLVINAGYLPPAEHERRYNNVQGLKEVAVLLPDQYDKSDIVVQTANGNFQTISDTHRSYDPLHYPTLFPEGEDGWHTTLELQNASSGAALNAAHGGGRGGARGRGRGRGQSSDAGGRGGRGRGRGRGQSSDAALGRGRGCGREQSSEAALGAGGGRGRGRGRGQSSDAALGGGRGRGRGRGQSSDAGLGGGQGQQGRGEEGDAAPGRGNFAERIHNARTRVSTLQFYAYKLHFRSDESNVILMACRLLQEYVCMAYAKIENQRLFYHEANQEQYRTEQYQRLADAVNIGDHQSRIGRVLLPSSFTGSNRYFFCMYHDAMAVVRVVGRPDLFITMTCNPQWPEILRELLPGQQAHDRPDLLARVFHLKYQELLDDIIKRQIFGRPVAVMATVEFQKRGLPHAHILVVLADDDKIRSNDDVDAVISAEIPENAELRKLVLKHMLHNRCDMNDSAPCLQDGKCSKHFPKCFQVCTEMHGASAYPQYRRRSPEDGGLEAQYGGKLYNNSWVVPYSPLLLMKYQCHLNVEVSGSILACKYIYKYIYKGSDRAMVSTEDEQPVQEQNEIKLFKDMRYIGSCEGAFRIFQFDLCYRVPAVTALTVHLPNMQNVSFRQGQEASVVISGPPRTQLTEFFAKNCQGNTNFKYSDFPTHFTWDLSTKTWKARVRNQQFPTIGRIYTVHIGSGELFYLRLLLCNDHCINKKSFEDLMTITQPSDGGVVSIRHPSFKATCQALGILSDDHEYDEALGDAVHTNKPDAVRELFVFILVMCEPADAATLLDKHMQGMVHDFKEKYRLPENSHLLQTLLLLDLEEKLDHKGKTLSDFYLPEITDAMRHELSEALNIREDILPAELRNEMYDHVHQQQTASLRIPTLLPSQRALFDAVMQAVQNDQQFYAFVDAPGGTGKTYTFNTLLAAVRGLRPESMALAVASSGIAATLLEGGTTFHSRFKVNLLELTCCIKAQSALADLIRKVEVILWDEAPMMNSTVLKNFESTLRDITGVDAPFGGKRLVLAGDFRQTLPVVKRGSVNDILASTLKASPLWHHFKIFRLTENMRVRVGGVVSNERQEYANWMLQLGSGELPTIKHKSFNDMITMRPDICLPDGDLEKLLEWTFPNIQERYNDNQWMAERVILCPKNICVNQVNDKMISEFPADEEFVCWSADQCEDTGDGGLNPDIEILNNLNVSGFPPHKLILKKGMPIVLLRNLNRAFCNGTRLIVKSVINRRLLVASLAGSDPEVEVHLPRIKLHALEDGTFPFKWSRKQFPVSPAFATTINKSQGQTLKVAGIYLSDPCFTHGQLYVAVSRVGDPDNIRLAIKRERGDMFHKTRNIVYKQVLL